MLEIRLFGTGSLNNSGRQAIGFPNQLPYLLLCYILLNRYHSHHREQLASVFWADCSTQSSRKCLRNTLWRLRLYFQTIGISIDEYLDIVEEYITFITTSSYWLDIEEFENIITQYHEVIPQDLTSEQVSQIQSASALYCGNLLENIYEDWCLYDRERYYLLYLETLYKLMAYFSIHGEYTQGIRHGEKILKLDGSRENIHRQMMLLYYLAGDRDAAFRQYHLCSQILQQEFGASPTEETKSLFEQICHNHYTPKQWAESSIPSRTDTHQTEVPDAPLVSQIHKEFHHLQEMLDAARSESRLVEKMLDKIIHNPENISP